MQKLSPLPNRMRLAVEGEHPGVAVRGRGQCLIHRPAGQQSRAEARRRYANHLGPFSKTHGFALESDSLVARTLPGGSFISSLLLRRCPSRIAGLVVPIRIGEAINACAGRTFSHVRQEVLKGVPSLADGDAAPAVIRIPREVRIAAARKHAVPASVGRTDVPRSVVTMSGRTLPKLLQLQTAARSRGVLGKPFCGSHKCRGNDRPLGSTFTFAKPSCLSIVGICRPRKNGPANDRPSGQVNEFCHT